MRIVTTALAIVWLGMAATGRLDAVEEAKQTLKNEKGKAEMRYATVTEKHEAMGYYYLKVRNDKSEEWIAVTPSPVKVGDTVGYERKMVIRDFKSKALHRTFKTIVFVDRLYLPEKKARLTSLKSVLSQTSPATDRFVKKPFYTVEEVHRFAKHLAGKRIKVKGSVYKVARDIMHRDWVHIGDGTGDETALTDDLVFTAKKTTIKAGDRVVAEGTLATDKDFGFGYRYRVLAEHATFKRIMSKEQ